MARPTTDGLTLYHATYTLDGDLDLLVATRETPEDVFEITEPLFTLNTAWDEASPTLSEDALTIFFSSYRSGTTYRIYRATRASTEDDFGSVVMLAGLSLEPFADAGPYFNSAAGQLYFHTGRDGQADLYQAALTPQGFETPQPVAGVNSGAVEVFPVMATDRLTLYFGRYVTDSTDIWVATRSDTSEPFDAIQMVEELATSADEAPSWISPDLCRLYFTRKPLGSWQNSVVYEATREPVP